MAQARLEGTLDRLGRQTLQLLHETGAVALLLGRAARWIGRGTLEWPQTVRQMARVGVESIPIILVTGAFSGMVLAFQTTRQLVRLGGQGFVGGLVSLSLAREAAPVFTAVTVAGRIGAGFAAEIGTMAVTEQLDALRVLATDPVRYLVVPRLLAGLVMLPVLTVFANAAGFVGGLLIAASGGVSPPVYLGSVRRFLDAYDLVSGLGKAAAFGVIIALIGAYRGLVAAGGAEGVGRATTGAVVTAIVLILVCNYFLDLVLF